ncbi:MAG: transposase-like protein [Bradymonadia bacterium]|jgi:transposase-like protein
MGTKRRLYGADFKAELCEPALSGAQAFGSLSSEHSICTSSIYGWIREATIALGDGLGQPCGA